MAATMSRGMARWIRNFPGCELHERSVAPLAARVNLTGEVQSPPDSLSGPTARGLRAIGAGDETARSDEPLGGDTEID